MKKLNIKLIMKMLGLMCLVLLLHVSLKMVTREGFKEGYKKEYNNKRVSPNQAGPHTEDANKLQAKIERQTQQSKENNRVAKATMPKKR